MAEELTQYHGVGKRKTSIARVYLRPDSDEILINKRPLEEYLPRENLRLIALHPLKITDNLGKFGIKVNVKGGGMAGQAGAISHGIARALLEYDPDLRPVLKKAGLLTRDARKKERKKTGIPKARKRAQWTKR